MTKFNDGIEAAANHIRRQLQHAAPDQRVILSGLVYEIEALKRPEPSEVPLVALGSHSGVSF